MIVKFRFGLDSNLVLVLSICTSHSTDRSCFWFISAPALCVDPQTKPSLCDKHYSRRSCGC